MLPAFIEPALPLLRSEPPPGPLWSHEVKFDGWRVQVHRDGGEAVLLSRHGIDITARFPHVARAASQLPVASFVVDGELVAFNAQGRPDIDALSCRGCNAYLCAFDILFADHEDLRPLPLRVRRGELFNILRDAASSHLTVPEASATPLRFCRPSKRWVLRV